MNSSECEVLRLLRGECGWLMFSAVVPASLSSVLDGWHLVPDSDLTDQRINSPHSPQDVDHAADMETDMSYLANSMILDVMEGGNYPSSALELQRTSDMDVSVTARPSIELQSLVAILNPGARLYGFSKAEILKYTHNEILISGWLPMNAPEPRDWNGRSVYLIFLSPLHRKANRDGATMLQCIISRCGKEFDRQDRAVAHVRGHFDHRPFPCEGSCGDIAW